MRVQFIKQSSASSLGYTEKVTNTRADPSLCYHGSSQGVEEAGQWLQLTAVVQDAVASLRRSKTQLLLRVLTAGRLEGLLGAPGAPQGGQQRGWELHGAARGCSQG